MLASLLERRSCSDMSANVTYQLIQFSRVVTGIYDIRHFHGAN
jgi:hypothetical protein